METVKKDLIRQGDLLFTPVNPDAYPFNGYIKDGKYYGYRKDGVIQEGEATGHHHKLEKPDSADVYRPSSQPAFIKVGKEQAVVVHEDHAPITLDANTAYQVSIAREEDPTGEIRRVVD